VLVEGTNAYAKEKGAGDGCLGREIATGGQSENPIARAHSRRCRLVFVTGRGGAGFHSPDPALTRGRGGGMFRVIRALPPSGAHPHSFPGRGPVC